jgi:IMP dehydrogenase
MIGSLENIQTALTYDDVSISPRHSVISSRSEIDTSVYLDEERNIRLKIPVIASPMDTVCESTMAIAMAREGAMGIIHRFMSIEKQVEEINKFYEAHRDEPVDLWNCGAAIGEKEEDKERVRAIAEKTMCSVLNLDVAHGDHKMSVDMIKWISTEFPERFHIMTGAICTASAFDRLRRVDKSVKSFRVGVGSGSSCETRIRSGVGVPQVTAINQCATHMFNVSQNEEYINKSAFKKIIVADGGIRNSGDIAKAIAAGAHIVMLGGLLAGTKETPGQITKIGLWPNEQLFKKYRGAASYDHKMSHQKNEGDQIKNVEGNSMLVPYKGKVKRILNDIHDGLRSAFSYVNARNMKEFQENAEFVRVTVAGQIEATPHGMKNNRSM